MNKIRVRPPCPRSPRINLVHNPSGKNLGDADFWVSSASGSCMLVPKQILFLLIAR